MRTPIGPPPAAGGLPAAPAAVAEMLRLITPTTFTAVTVSADTEVDGRPQPARAG